MRKEVSVEKGASSSIPGTTNDTTTSTPSSACVIIDLRRRPAPKPSPKHNTSDTAEGASQQGQSCSVKRRARGKGDVSKPGREPISASESLPPVPKALPTSSEARQLAGRARGLLRVAVDVVAAPSARDEPASRERRRRRGRVRGELVESRRGRDAPPPERSSTSAPPSTASLHSREDRLFMLTERLIPSQEQRVRSELSKAQQTSRTPQSSLSQLTHAHSILRER